jgi:hypothetical protein
MDVNSRLHLSAHFHETRIKFGKEKTYLGSSIGSTTTCTDVKLKATTFASLPYFGKVSNAVCFWNAFGSPVTIKAVIDLYISSDVPTFATGPSVVLFASGKHMESRRDDGPAKQRTCSYRCCFPWLC